MTVPGHGLVRSGPTRLVSHLSGPCHSFPIPNTLSSSLKEPSLEGGELYIREGPNDPPP